MFDQAEEHGYTATSVTLKHSPAHVSRSCCARDAALKTPNTRDI